MAYETTEQQTDSGDTTTLLDDFIFPFSTNRRLQILIVYTLKETSMR